MENLMILLIGAYFGYCFSAQIRQIIEQHKKFERYAVLGLFSLGMGAFMGWGGFIMTWLVPCAFLVFPSLKAFCEQKRFCKNFLEIDENGGMEAPVQKGDG